MSEQTEANNRWQVKEVWPFVVNFFTLIAVAIYACYARQQVTETQAANAIAKQALAEVNRPYVMFASLYPNNTADNNGVHKRIGITWTNFGNTPALNPTFYMCKPIVRDDFTPPPYP